MSFRTPQAYRTPEASTSRASPVFRRFPRSIRSVESTFDNVTDSFSFSQSFATPEVSIKRFLEIGEFESAVYWIDKAYAQSIAGDEHRDPIKFANYIKLLISAQQWLRVTAIIDSGDKFYMRHVLFAYFYIKSLFERKQYAEVANAQIGHMVEIENVPLKPACIINGVEAYLTGHEAPITVEQKSQLDEMAAEYSVYSSLLLILGQTFFFLENRAAAAKFLRKALVEDPHCLKAEQLLLQYKLLDLDDEQHIHDLAVRREPERCETDPRIMAKRAKELYAKGNPRAAIRITSTILKNYGWYMDCLVTHINSLAILEDTNTLFTFSHQIVDAMPDHEFAWYAVSMYYYACKNTAQAKAYIHKATLMCSSFGDGWLAYGHFWASDSDTDQAIQHYGKAARIMEKNFEPCLYLGVQYGSGTEPLATSFLDEAAKLAPNNPIVIQEQACLLYAKEKYREALHMYEKALKLVLVGEDSSRLTELTEEPHVYVDRHSYPIELFWAPLLNNLGHCCRRLELLEKSMTYHRAAILLVPNNSQAMCSHAMALFASGNQLGATQQLNRALAIQPFDSVNKEVLDAIVRINNDYVRPTHWKGPDDEMITSEELDDLFKTKTRIHTKETPTMRRNREARAIGPAIR